MSIQDPIADMLTRIRNGQTARKPSVRLPASKVKVAIVKILESEGYISGYEVINNETKKELEIALKYFNGRPVIEKLDRISKPSQRIYKSVHDLEPVMGGLGIAIISTSKGLLTDKMARKAGVGGEVLCAVA